jgi:hypothetical protein
MMGMPSHEVIAPFDSLPPGGVHDKVRGTNVTNGIAVLVEKLGAERLRQVLAHLPESARTLPNRRILAIEWVPLEDWYAVLAAALEELYHGDEAQILQLSREMCARDFHTVYRFFLRLAPKSLLLNRAGKIWRTYHTVGELSATEEAQDGVHHRVRYVLRDYEPLPLMAITLQGYIEQVLSMMGAKALVTRVARCEVIAGRLLAEITADFDEP